MTMLRNRHIYSAAVAIVALVALLLGPWTARQAWSGDPDEVTSVCLDCHDDGLHSLMGTGHDLGRAGKAGVSCVSCHFDALEGHIDDDEILPFNPAKAPITETAKVCVRCHTGFHSANAFERDPHTGGNLACNACHKVHDNRNAGLLADKQPDLCYECHASVRGDFYQPYRHPVTDEVLRCSECHLETFKDRKQGVYSGPSATCFQCHRRQIGPFPFEHQATVDYSTQQGGCLNCHAPHGSPNPRMLKQPYDLTNQALCNSCHTVPLHESNSYHGTLWSGVPCSDCHVDIHGSYDNKNFLDPSLQGQGCFNSGCHAY